MKCMHIIWRHRASVWLCLGGGQHYHHDNTCQLSEWQDSGTPLKGYLDQDRWARKTHLNHTRLLFRVWGPGEKREEKEMSASIQSSLLGCSVAGLLKFMSPYFSCHNVPIRSPSNYEPPPPNILSVLHDCCQDISLQHSTTNTFSLLKMCPNHHSWRVMQFSLKSHEKNLWVHSGNVPEC